MPTKNLKTYDAPTLNAWRQWLADHYATESEVWLIFHKRHTGRPFIAYDDAVDAALCFGWIDSLIKRLDDDRYARTFTPRKADSRWSTANRERYARLKAAGKLQEAGLKRPPTDRDGDAPAASKVPQYMQEALRKRPGAWKFFQNLAPSHRRKYIGWIDSARREETKLRRLRQAIGMLEAGKKPGI